MTKSAILEAMEALAYEIEESSTWFNPPQIQWYPDLDRKDLRTGGPIAVILPPTATAAPVNRGKTGNQMQLDLHVAIVAPIVAGTLAEGDAVILRAADVATLLVHSRLPLATAGRFLAVLEAEIDPVIVADYAKQFNLWVSYLKLECRVGTA